MNPFCSRDDTGIKGKDIVADIKTLRKGKWHAAAKTPTSAELHQYLSYYVLGINNVTPVFGLSSGRRRKATLRGELQLTYNSTGAFLKKAKKYVKNGTVIHYMTLGFVKADGTIGRDPAFPNLPTVWDVYKKMNGKELTGLPSRGLKHLLNMVGSGSKSLMMPKGTADDVVDAYVSAVKKIRKDKKFMKIAKKEIGDYPQSIGKSASKIVKEAVDLKPDMKKWMKQWIQKRFNVAL